MSQMSSTNPLLVGIVSAVTAVVVLKYINDGTRYTTDEQDSRDFVNQLGPWAFISGAKRGGKQIAPLGPQIIGRLADGLCGSNDALLSRLPQGEMGTACWSVLLSVVRPQEPTSPGATPRTNDTTSWPQISLQPLTNYDSQLCVNISRATLMTLFAITNARPIFTYTSAAGYRSAYPSYCGQWSISWPIGKPCVVRLSPHDSHDAKTDMYPPAFAARIDKCVEMLAGIITDGKEWKIAFPGRAKCKGNWKLQERKKGFGGAHGSRHLYNMQGGKVFEVDLLVLVPCDPLDGVLHLQIPCLGGKNYMASLFVQDHEAALLAKALDHLPWSSLSWSLHRGMRDVLLAYGKSVMNRYRAEVAALLRVEVEISEDALVKKGWAPEFVKGPMAEMAASAFLSGGGNSGDLVRVAVAAAECLLERHVVLGSFDLDKTKFWVQKEPEMEAIQFSKSFSDRQLSFDDLGMVVALTKFFVLEWSQELDYQLYHELPVDILLA